MFWVAPLTGLVNGRHFSGDGRGEFEKSKRARGGVERGGGQAAGAGPAGAVTCGTALLKLIRPSISIGEGVAGMRSREFTGIDESRTQRRTAQYNQQQRNGGCDNGESEPAAPRAQGRHRRASRN